MHCYVILYNVFQLMCKKMCIHYSTRDLLTIYKVCLSFLLLYTLYGMAVLFLWRSKFSWILLGFLSMMIYEVLYT